MRKLAIFTGGFVLAAAIGVYLLSGQMLLPGLCLLAAAILFLIRKPKKALWMGLLLLGAAAGCLRTALYVQQWLRPAETLMGRDQEVRAVVRSVPMTWEWGGKAEILVQAGEKSYPATLYADESLLTCLPGDEISCTADVDRVKTKFLQGERLQAAARGEILMVFGREVVLENRGEQPLPVRLQLWLQSRIHKLYEGDTAAFLQAILTGDRRDLTYGLKTAFSLSGISHVIAVSGMHLSLLVVVAAMLCFKNPRLTAMLGCPMIVLFAIMTGAGPSVCRAAVMQMILLLAPVVRRQSDPITTIAAAALVLLLENPWSVASVSLQMSFAAVLGLFLMAERMRTSLLRHDSKPTRLKRAAVLAASTTFSANLLTLPFSCLYFGTVSLASPLTNLLVLWAVGILMPLAAVSLLAGPVGFVLAWPVKVLCAYVLWVARTIAAFPYAASSLESPIMMVWTIGLYGLVTLWLLYRKRISGRALICLVLSGFLVSVWTGWSRVADTVTVLDTGEGQCVLLQQDGFTAVVDCGGTDDQRAAEAAARTLRGAGITHMDILLLTKLDRPHAGGLSYLLEQMDVSHVYYPAGADDGSLRAWLESRGCGGGPVADWTNIRFPQGNITVYPLISGKKQQNSSLCVLASAGEYDILVPGDLSPKAQERLLARWDLPQADLLVAGRQAGGDTVSRQLLTAIRPQTVVLCSGAENPPDRGLINQIQWMGAHLRRTDLEGTIRIKP